MNQENSVEEDVATFVEGVIADQQMPVVLFALEWCEFCWSVRKLFEKNAIAYRSVDLDSAEYQKNHRGRAIRNALRGISGSETIPQIFVGGEFIGGCTETFEAYKSGDLQQKLNKSQVAYRQPEGLDPYSLLPKWLQPR